MRIPSLLPVALVALTGCADRLASRPAPAATPVPASFTAPPREPSSAETLAEADEAYVAQLGASRGGRFDTERQITVLKRAVLLYTQFLERAAGRPELEPAVKKSRERIADARDTIAFLEASLREPSASP